MRVRILNDREYRTPDDPRVSIDYKAGQELTIKHEWGQDLVASGDAAEIDPPRRPTKPDATEEEA